MRALRCISITVALLVLAAPSARAELYLELEAGGVEIRGDATAQGEENSILLTSFSQENRIDVEAGGGTAGRELVGPLRITKIFDSASIAMQVAMGRIDRIDLLEIRAYDRDQNGVRRHYLTVFTDRAQFTRRLTFSDDQGRAMETWEVVFDRVVWRNELTGEEYVDDQGGLSSVTNPLERGTAELAPVPNPTSGRTSFAFRLPETGHVTIDVYDLRGRFVTKVFDGPTLTTQSVVEWDGTDGTGQRVAPGVYMVKMRTGQWLTTRKLSVVR